MTAIILASSSSGMAESEDNGQWHPSDVIWAPYMASQTTPTRHLFMWLAFVLCTVYTVTDYSTETLAIYITFSQRDNKSPCILNNTFWSRLKCEVGHLAILLYDLYYFRAYAIPQSGIA